MVLSTLLSSVVLAEPNNAYSYPDSIHENSTKEAPLWTESQSNIAKQEAFLLTKITQNPDAKAAYANLANLYLSNNKTKKAIDAYQNAIIVDPNNAKLFAGLSIAYLHQSKYSMAKTMAEQAVELDPNMEHAKKIQEYITKKEAIIAQTSASSNTIPSGMPTDSTHNKVHE
ncbi:MAG: tetratricopeptide repeat protein [Gammaproteobacteria bacterium]|nr:tetratricopeptide repeat protein [Gammaproteobacteria bacterium]